MFDATEEEASTATDEIVQEVRMFEQMEIHYQLRESIF